MRQITCAAAAVLMATAFACSPRDRQETANKVDSVAEDVREETREGAAEVREEAREARDYTYAQRNEFRRDLDLQLQKLDEQIAGIERDTKRGVDRARDSAIVNVRTARRAVTRDLDRLGSAAESKWDEAKRNLNESLSALDREVRRLLPDARPMGGTGPS
jgi:molecular chaperone GrpE (heat shock protein)